MKMLSAFQVVAAFDEIIQGATRSLVIITPYLDPWPHLTATLLQKLDQKLSVQMLLRGGDECAKSEEAARPFARRGASVEFLERLHAKIYVSEHQALLTSMNLIKPSRDSWEVGTLFDAVADAVSYRDVVSITQSLFETVRLTRPGVRAEPAKDASRPGARSAKAEREPSGYCIRCSERIVADPKKPLCRGCYSAWAEWKNEEYEENFCLGCGRPWISSVGRPLCRSCWGGGS
jgi:hypothetical protein